MGDTRFRDGLAYGPYANFYARSDNIFGQTDATPDVTVGNLFFSNNTSTTTITHFDLTSANTGGTWSQQFEGKQIKVFFLDDSTRLVNGGQLILSGSDGLIGANNFIELIYHNSAWLETNRSYNSNNVINVTSASLNTTAAAGTGQVIVRGRGPYSVLFLASETTTPVVLRQVIGGEQGTQLNLVVSGGSDALIIINSASNIDGLFVGLTTGASSTQFRLASSSSVIFTKFGARWIEARPIFINSSAVGVA